MAPIVKQVDKSIVHTNQQTSQPFYDKEKIFTAFDVDLKWDNFKLTNEEEDGMVDNSIEENASSSARNKNDGKIKSDSASRFTRSS